VGGERVGDSSTVEKRTLTPSIAGSNPAPSASYYVFDIASVFVFLGSLFSREFAGFTVLEFKAICGRDGCTRDFGYGRHENLSGALSWLILCAGWAADTARKAKVGARKFTQH
jgi:hypothetical protein